VKDTGKPKRKRLVAALQECLAVLEDLDDPNPNIDFAIATAVEALGWEPVMRVIRD
jgi:hypothetical protein